MQKRIMFMGKASERKAEMFFRKNRTEKAEENEREKAHFNRDYRCF